jgi:thioesterase domain-containing protein/acyl carrier protein
MAAIWEEVLDAGPVGPDDDFFALGGDSLAAVEILDAVARRLGRKLEPTALSVAPTCRALAELAAAPPGPRDSPMVPIARGEGDPLVLIPGAGGSLHGFAAMLRAAPPGRPVFGVRLPGPGADAPGSIEELAARLLGPLREAQPQGPYRLAGYSFGGRVAVELARQLLAVGLVVAFVGLFDTYGPGYPRAKSITGRVSDHFRAWARLDATGRRRYAREAMARARGRGRSGPVPECLRDETLYHLELGRRYEPRPYPGRLTLFRAEVRPFVAGSDFSDPHLGWGRVAAGGVQVVPVPGDHFSLFAEPHARALGIALAANA